MDISHLLKHPKSGWFGHRETPGSSKVERYQPYYFYGNEYIGAKELLLEKIKDYCLGDFTLSIITEQNGKTDIKLIDDDNNIFISSSEETYEECLVSVCKQIYPEMFK